MYCEAIIRNSSDRTFVISSTASLVVRGESLYFDCLGIICPFCITLEMVLTHIIVAPNTITVTWNALPFTNYCVDVNRTTLDSTETVVLDSECGLTNEYIFTYFNPISVCDRFSFTVTPTEGEMRGTTSEPVTGFFIRGQKVCMLHSNI